jgi:uncharacterized membrane protein YphA (DoxX/SURF4 family)
MKSYPHSKFPVVQTIRLLLIVLWVYTATSKLNDVTLFKHQLDQQHFLAGWAGILVWLLPAAEFLVAGLIILPATTKKGFIGSLLLLIIFTGYIILILAGFFNQIPCACGGVLQLLNWPGHLIFNLLFVLLNGYGVHLLTLRKEVAEV